MRRRAALPAMGEERKQGENLAEKNARGAYGRWKQKQNLGALHEMAGVREFLTERAIRRIVLDRITIAGVARTLDRRARLSAVQDDSRRCSWRCSRIDMYMRLDDEKLNRQCEQRENNE